MKPAKDLCGIAFPMCTTECALIKQTGVCECESVCPPKFRAVTGQPYAFENLSQRELDMSEVRRD